MPDVGMNINRTSVVCSSSSRLAIYSRRQHQTPPDEASRSIAAFRRICAYSKHFEELASHGNRARG